jgi:hypothetical protein
MEQIVLPIDTPEEALRAIREKVQQLSRMD